MRALLLCVVLASQALADLAVVQGSLLLYEDGTPAAPGQKFREGETIHVNFQVSGYGRSNDEDAPKVAFAYRVEVADPAGVPVVVPHSGKLAATLAPEDKNWLPKVRYKFTLPEAPRAGTYEIRVQVRDEVSGEEAAHRMAFAVTGQTFEHGSTLAVRNFRYLRLEDEKNAITAVKAGEPFEARFLLTGYKLGEQNSYHVRYGIAFLNEAGKPIFADPDAAALGGKSFYPRLYVPAAMTLRLERKVKPGHYRLQITAEDLVGGQKMQSEFPIRVDQ